MKTETDEANPDHSLILGDIRSQVFMNHIEATLDQNTDIDATTTGAVHDDLTQATQDTATNLAVTLHISHISDHPNIKTFQVINPEITVAHIHNHPIDQDMNLTNQIHIPAGQKAGHIPRRT